MAGPGPTRRSRPRSTAACRQCRRPRGGGAPPAALVAVQASTGALLRRRPPTRCTRRTTRCRQVPRRHRLLGRRGRRPAPVGRSTRSRRCRARADRTVGGARFQQVAGSGGTSPTFRPTSRTAASPRWRRWRRRIGGRADASRRPVRHRRRLELPLRTFSGSMPAPDGDAAREDHRWADRPGQPAVDGPRRRGRQLRHVAAAGAGHLARRSRPAAEVAVAGPAPRP